MTSLIRDASNSHLIKTVGHKGGRRGQDKPVMDVISQSTGHHYE